MKLSTTINFFTYEDDGSYSAYYYDLEHYAKLGFSHLDSIFCLSLIHISEPTRRS